MTTLVNIRCRELSLSISREQCGAQVTRPYAPAVCRSCEVGAAHVRGEAPTHWPDGSPVIEVVHVVAGSRAARGGRKPPAAPAFASRHKPRPRRTEEPAVRGALRPAGLGTGAYAYVYDGRELTAAELAALPGVEVSARTITSRLSAGWSVERAIRQRVERRRRA